ncbi:MAG: outer membrane protein assembly factor BamA [Candidatus Neomarinimicrobiota bacterium]
MKNIRIISIISFLLSTLSAQELPELNLLAVEVEGNQITSASVIRYTSGLAAGQTIAGTEFPRAVKRLWELGVFSNVQIRLDEETAEGIRITIAVKENYVLGHVHYEGNKKIKVSKFDEELGLTSGQRIQPSTISRTIRKMRELYTEDGYIQAEITGEIVDPRPVSVDKKRKKDKTIQPVQAAEGVRDLVFKIKENSKVKTRNVQIEGNDTYSDFRLRRVLKETKQQRWYLFWRGHFDEDKFEEDKTALGKFYRDRGYRDFAILSDSVISSADNNRLDLIIRVNEGPKYYYRNFSWSGNTLYSVDELNRRLNLSKGGAYSEQEFNLATYDRVQGLYMDSGYIYSQIQPQFSPVGTDSLDVNFLIVENHQVSVRNINITGNSKTRENVIRRELMLFPGDVFNREKLIQSQRKIFILNYFADVVPDVVPVDEDEIDLEITVEERSSDRASANIGFTGEYGMTGGGSLEFNNFDLSNPFRSGNGQQLSLSFNVGTQYSIGQTQPASKYHSVSLSFIDPMVRDSRNLIGFSLYYTLRGQSTYYYFPLDIELRGGSLRWGRRFKWPDDYFRGTWVFNAVNKRYTGTQDNIDRYVNGAESTLGLSITQIIARESRDHPEFPTRGSRMVWESTLSGGPLPGNEDYHKHILNLEWYTPTFSKFVLTGSLKMGAIQPLPDPDEEYSLIPLDEKFIMGGSGIPYGNMLRGYPDNSIGPQYNGSPIGGNAIVKYTAEFRFPFSENPVVYSLAFAEAGNVWQSHQLTEPLHLPRTSALNLRRSVGFGIRFFMPMVGMLGFDMGYGFDDITGDGKASGWNYHIIFGQQF